MTSQYHLNAVMKETTPVTPEPNPCPNCGWSETDEQGFQDYLAYQNSLPEPSRFQKILRRISDGPVFLSDCWYFISFMTCIQAFIDQFSASSGIHVDFPVYAKILLSSIVVLPVIASRFFWGVFSDFRFRRSFENDIQRS